MPFSPQAYYHFVADATERALTISRRFRLAIDPQSPSPAARTIHPPVRQRHAVAPLLERIYTHIKFAVPALFFGCLFVYIGVITQRTVRFINNPDEDHFERNLFLLQVLWALFLAIFVGIAPLPRCMQAEFLTGSLMLSLDTRVLCIGCRKIPLRSIRRFRCVTKMGLRRASAAQEYGIEVLSVEQPLRYGYIGDPTACRDVVEKLNAMLVRFRDENGTLSAPALLSDAFYKHEKTAVSISSHTPLPEVEPQETKFTLSYGADTKITRRRESTIARRLVLFFFLGSVQWVLTFPFIINSVEPWFTKGWRYVLIIIPMVFWVSGLLQSMRLWLRPEQVTLTPRSIRYRCGRRIFPVRSRFDVQNIGRVELYVKRAETVSTSALKRRLLTDAVGWDRFGVRFVSHEGEAVGKLRRMNEGDAMFVCSALRKAYPQMFPATAATVEP